MPELIAGIIFIGTCCMVIGIFYKIAEIIQGVDSEYIKSK